MASSAKTGNLVSPMRCSTTAKAEMAVSASRVGLVHVDAVASAVIFLVTNLLYRVAGLEPNGVAEYTMGCNLYPSFLQRRFSWNGCWRVC